ncbi:MAG: hypothetical protein ACRD96_10725, partial [Bryobacteraceae bacterium]
MHTAAPYWRHRTMSCAEAADRVRHLNRRLMAGRVSLNAALHYSGLLGYDPRDRDVLLARQKSLTRSRLFDRAFDFTNWLVDRRLARDIKRALQPAAA